jgi:putative transposase
VEVVKTLKLRVKDRHAKTLLAMARDVNTVWNFCNETQYRSLKRYCNKPQTWLSGFDLQKLTNGFVKCDGVTASSATVQLVCEEFAARLRQHKKQRLNWRVSDPKSPKYSLGWIPFKRHTVKLKDGKLRFNGLDIGVWDSFGLSKYDLRGGSFNEDARGRWYVNVYVHAQAEERRVPRGVSAIGIDLGVKVIAAYSNGDVFDAPKWYKDSESKLAVAQRARKKKLARSLHAKIRNRRQDSIHKETTSLVRQHAAIFVGNVSARAMAKTSMAKSVHDASWSTFRAQLKYKAIRQCVVFSEVNEAYSTQTCSCCGVIPPSSPKGRAGLGIRRWTCSECGAEHDRDTNAARNIARLGLQSLEVGALVCEGEAKARKDGL